MSRINPPKIQQKAVRQLQLYVNPTAKYPLSVCVCIHTYDTKNMKTIEKLMSNFAKSFVVFVGDGDPPEHGICIPSKGAPETVCRNIYLSFVIAYRSSFDIMLVVDPDLSLHTEIPSSSLSCCSPERLSTWDAVFANQSYKYYDTHSLRIDGDPKKFKKHIPSYTEPIPVKSAFGGLAMYKTSFLSENMYDYDGHITFNTRYISNGGVRMFLEPSLVLETPPQNAKLYL